MAVLDAIKENSKDLAFLLNLAGEGIPAYLWGKMAEGDESPIEVGARRAARGEGSFSYTNARICVEKEHLLGMMVSYKQPDPYELDDLSDYPEVVRPLVQLEAKAPGSWYVNAVATYAEYRGKGVGRLLMQDAEGRARENDCSLMSLIVASENGGAKNLYEHLGYETVAAKPVIPYPGCLHGGDWLLMVKHL